MDNFEFQKAKKVCLHDRIFAATVLRLIPSWMHPNHFTIFRFATTPIIILLLYFNYYTIGFWAFLIAASTDAIDGSLARTRNQITEWGKVYDPLADKILIASMIFIIVLQTLGLWTSIVIIGLEIVIVIAAWMRKMEGRVIQANLWGKIKMILQVLGVSVLLLVIIYNWAALLPFASGMLYLAIIFAVISLLTHGI
jgi:CDP-diacylglycerol--glycerol-3-phosphate 3-phosphatidyltransferase